MMEQLAERRMKREDLAQTPQNPNLPYNGHHHDPAPPEEDYEDDEDEEYDEDDEDYEEEDDDMVCVVFTLENCY
jgi:ribosomal protein L12E/L44/L45/RPP1/RPP2